MFNRTENTEPIGKNECFFTVVKEYAKGEIITNSLLNDDTIGIIKSGTAYLFTSNSEGQNRIIDYYVAENVFGNSFIPKNDDRIFYITAKTKCTVEFLKYKKVITPCDKKCSKHIQLLDNMVMQSVRKSLAHIDILGQRTLRGKLMTFFEYMSIQKNSKNFTLPMPLSDFADYLAVDRSAMMRELKNLNSEGVIKSDKRKIKLLY